MAELNVQPKRSSPWWLWVLIILVAIAILIFLFRGSNTTTGYGAADSTASSADTGIVAATTSPNWNTVDFNAPEASYEEIKDRDIVVRGNEDYSIYILGENILFPTDRNELQAGATDKLEQLSASLSKRFKGSTIGVYGSTDSTGTTGHNQRLGAERAEAVKNWLIQNGGIPANTISVHSLGESEPVSTNATAPGRQQNRNVQVVAFSQHEQN